MAGRRLAACAVFVALAALYMPRASAQSVAAVPTLDVAAYAGTWYEIARYPNKWEKRCAGNAGMLTAPGDKARHIQIVRACRTRAGYVDTVNLEAKPQNKKVADGRFKQGYWPLYRKFWVLALAPDETWTLVGSPNHKDLWIYAKTNTIAPELYAEIQAKAVAEGFAAGKLTLTPQNLAGTDPQY